METFLARILITDKVYAVREVEKPKYDTYFSRYHPKNLNIMLEYEQAIKPLEVENAESGVYAGKPCVWVDGKLYGIKTGGKAIASSGQLVDIVIKDGECKIVRLF